MSAIGEAIDAVLAAGLVPALKLARWKRSRRTFRRADGDAVMVTHVQASQGSAGAEGLFTVNLGVYFAAVDTVSGNRVLEAPCHYECPLRVRLGLLMPEHRDHWWKVVVDAPVEALATEVADAWRQFGLPWFERHRDLRTALANRKTIDELTLTMWLASGDRERSRGVLQQLLADEKCTPGQSLYLRRLGERHGLPAS
jgi:hypothetical protein